MRTLEGASMMLITTAVVLMLVALPIGLSLSSSIISNNTVTTDQPIGDAPFKLPEDSGYITEYADGKWEIKTENGPFCECPVGEILQKETTITIGDSYEWVSFAVYLKNDYDENVVYPILDLTVSDANKPNPDIYRQLTDHTGEKYEGYIEENGEISGEVTAGCTIKIDTETIPKITCNSTGEVHIYIKIIDFDKKPTSIDDKE